MYLCGYNLDNLSLMALTIATGFVVDDAIVVLENVTRHMEAGNAPAEAALPGAREISFTVLSMSTSLVAVFTPILLMGGMVGRLFREFAVTLSMAIGVSLLVSLTTTPMMCAAILKPRNPARTFYRASERVFDWMHSGYDESLSWALRHPRFMILLTAVTVGGQHLPVHRSSRKGSSRSRTPGASPEGSWRRRTFRSSPCGRSWRRSSTSSGRIPRSTR